MLSVNNGFYFKVCFMNGGKMLVFKVFLIHMYCTFDVYVTCLAFRSLCTATHAYSCSVVYSSNVCVRCKVCTVLYRNTVQHNTDVHQTSNKTGLCKFPKLCTVCTVQCTVAYKCAVQKYCTALYKCSSMLK